MTRRAHERCPTGGSTLSHVRPGIGALVCAALLVVPATAPVAAQPTVRAAKACHSIHGRGYRWTVRVEKGHVSCRKARKVLSAFLHGKGHMHGPANGPAYQQWRSVYHWRCGNGAGAVGCSRHSRLISATARY